MSFGHLRWFHNPDSVLTASLISRYLTTVHADVALRENDVNIAL